MGSNNREVDPKVKEFLVLNIVVLGLVVIYLLRRKPGSKMRFSLRSGDGTTNKEEAGKTGATPIGVNPKVEGTVLSEKESKLGSAGKSLNVIFNYNGHSWDAYEVLGVPAGSSPDRVKEAFESSLAQVEPESRVFVETAYNAILTHLKR